MNTKECISEYFIHNGQLLPVEKFDSNWLYFGRSVYEVFRVINGIPLFWKDHYDRLIQSMNLTGIPFRFSEQAVTGMIGQLISGTEKYGNIKIIMNHGYKTEGVDETDYHLIIYFVHHIYPTVQQYKSGVPAITLRAERNNPNAKMLNQELRDRATRLVREQGVYEALLVDRSGHITEGSRTNLFMIRDGQILTPPLKEVLPGVTRKYVLQLCDDFGMGALEESFPVNDIPQMEAVFITGTSPKILPLVSIDDYVFNSESILLYRLMKAFDERIESHLKSEHGKWVR
jgi:branched-chain amino acid aminotransferase